MEYSRCFFVRKDNKSQKAKDKAGTTLVLLVTRNPEWFG